MTEIYNGFRMFVVIAVVLVIVFFAAPLIPQITALFTLPERISAENAQNASDALAAPTFTALRVQATASAIENEHLRAQAAANAQTIQAQGHADATRVTAETWQFLATGAVVLAGTALVMVFVFFVLRLWAGQRSAQRVDALAIEQVSKSGGTLLLQHGQTVQYLSERERADLLTAGTQEPSGLRHTTEPSARQSVPYEA